MKDAQNTTRNALRMALGLPATVKTAKGMESTRKALRTSMAINTENRTNSDKKTVKILSE